MGKHRFAGRAGAAFKKTPFRPPLGAASARPLTSPLNFTAGLRSGRQAVEQQVDDHPDDRSRRSAIPEPAHGPDKRCGSCAEVRVAKSGRVDHVSLNGLRRSPRMSAGSQKETFAGPVQRPTYFFLLVVLGPNNLVASQFLPRRVSASSLGTGANKAREFRRYKKRARRVRLPKSIPTGRRSFRPWHSSE